MKILAMVLAMVVVPTRASALQADTTELEPITVTATRVPMAATAVTSSLTVLDGEDLRMRGLLSVADALREVPGATILQAGSFGATTSLFLRGGESDYVQVLIDGVRVNQPGGAYDFAHLSTANVERIEVLRGPGSVLYGSDAATGVVQIFTRRGSGAARYSAGAKAGTFGSVGLEADLLGGGDRVNYAFALSHFLSEGSYAFNNDYDNTVWSGRVSVQPDARSDVSIALRYRDSQFHFPTDGSGNLVDRNAVSLDEATAIAVDAGRWVTDDVELRLSLGSNVTSIGTDDRQDDPSDTTGFYSFRSLQDLRRQSADLRVNLHVHPGIIVTGGAEVERQDERGFNESMSEFGPSNGSTAEDRSNRSVYAQALFNQQGMALAVGLRLDDNDAFGTFWTYRGGVGYDITPTTRVRASVGKSFKAPTFFENFATGFVTGNPDLSPERSTSWEASVSQRAFDERIVVTGTYFSQSFSNLIQFAFDQTPNYANVAAADAAGAEFELAVHPRTDLSMVVGYTYLDTEVLDAGFEVGDGASFVVGNRLLRRPAHRLNARVSYTGWDRGRMGLSADYLGNRDDRNFSTFPATPVVLPSVTTIDVWGAVDIVQQRGSQPGISATLRVENLLDESYETVVGFPARGRTVFLGGRIAGVLR